MPIEPELSNTVLTGLVDMTIAAKWSRLLPMNEVVKDSARLDALIKAIDWIEKIQKGRNFPSKGKQLKSGNPLMTKHIRH